MNYDLIAIPDAERKGPGAMQEYKALKNKSSIDGIAGLRSPGGEGR